MQTRRSTRAFTLLEVLMATLCMAVIMAALNSTFYSAMHMRERTTALVEQALPFNQVCSLIKRDLFGILPGGTLAYTLTTTNYPANGLVFYTTSGVTADAVTNVPGMNTSLAPSVPYWSEVQMISYYLAPAPTRYAVGMDFVRGVTRNLLASQVPDLTEQHLLTGVESLIFSFYDGTNWFPVWDASYQTNLPLAVRMSIQFAAQTRGQQPRGPLEFMVPLDVQPRGTNQTTSTTSSGSGQQSGGSQTGGGSSGGGRSGGGSSGGGSSSGGRGGGSGR